MIFRLLNSGQKRLSVALIVNIFSSFSTRTRVQKSEIEFILIFIDQLTIQTDFLLIQQLQEVKGFEDFLSP